VSELELDGVLQLQLGGELLQRRFDLGAAIRKLERLGVGVEVGDRFDAMDRIASPGRRTGALLLR
jgi:hypothetical protein